MYICTENIVKVQVYVPHCSTENYTCKSQVGLRFCVDISRKCFNIRTVAVVYIKFDLCPRVAKNHNLKYFWSNDM